MKDSGDEYFDSNLNNDDPIMMDTYKKSITLKITEK